MNEKPKFMTHERIMAGEEYVSYSDYLLLQRERDEAREQANVMHEQWLSKGRCCENLAEELHEVKQQRDEAIARSKEWSDWCVEYKSERDEAREDAKNLVDYARYYLEELKSRRHPYYQQEIESVSKNIDRVNWREGAK